MARAGAQQEPASIRVKSRARVPEVEAAGREHASDALRALGDERWLAIVRCDPAADGRFWYSVRTTGVYCRPSCRSRLPRPENVRFHATRAEAEREGFRPCKRCRPDEPPLDARRAGLVAEACRRIAAAEEMPSLAELASASGMSRFHFHRVFAALTGLTPKRYALAHRADRVRRELEHAATVTEAIHASGFGSSGRFYASHGEGLGMRPTRFRAGGAGAVIRFATVECSLGHALVAATDEGVCAVLFGDDPVSLAVELAGRFPRASRAAGREPFVRLVRRALAVADETSAAARSLPIEVRRTALRGRLRAAVQGLGQVRLIDTPPSTRSVEPVVKLEASEAR